MNIYPGTGHKCQMDGSGSTSSASDIYCTYWKGVSGKFQGMKGMKNGISYTDWSFSQWLHSSTN